MKTCTIDGCEKPQGARGWCSMHYWRWRHHGDVHHERELLPPACAAPGCDVICQSRYCEKHRARLARTGSLDLPPKSTRREHSMGYQLVKREGHPLATKGWVYEHRANLYDAIGPGWHPCHVCSKPVSWDLTYPASLEALVVDHLNEDKANNEPTNLAPSCSVCNFQRSSRWVKREQRKAS